MTVFRSVRWNVLKVISPLIAAAAAVVLWPGFFKMALGSGHAISFVILIGLGIGSALIIWQSLRVNSRWEALVAFIAETHDEGRDWRSLAYVRSNLGQVMLRQESLGLSQEAIERDVQNLRIRVYQAQILPDFLVGLMVALGLVGTFVGLIYTLGDVGTMLSQLNSSAVDGSEVEQVFGRLVAQLQSPLTAMGTAFAASLFGLVGSILLGLMMVLLRGQVEDYMRAVRKFMLERLDVRNQRFSLKATESVNEEMLARQVHRLGELIERLGERQADSTRAHEALQRQLAQACEQEAHNRAQLEARFEQIGDWQDATIAQVHDAKERAVSMQNMLTALFERGDAAIQAMQVLTDSSATGVTALRHTTGLLTDLCKEQGLQRDALDRCVQGLAQAPAMLETLQAWNQAVGAHQDARLQAFEAQLQIIRALLERGPARVAALGAPEPA
ncbi:MAG: hypothetical protein ACN6O8_03845 [Achromobacter sp.]|uniref:hypothetical protein n=1 Tax=Achromobacter sp. TaxID=134375 RepID=UPI003CFCF08A